MTRRDVDGQARAPEVSDLAELRLRDVAPPSLSEEQVVERLCLNSKTLVVCIGGMVRAAVGEEERRATSLASKASAMLSGAAIASALTVSVSSSSGGAGWARGVAVVAFVTAAALSTLSMRIRSDNRGINEADVFNSQVLQHEDPHVYRRYMVAHLWRLYRAHFAVNDRRAAWLFWAPPAFVVGVISLAVQAILFTE